MAIQVSRAMEQQLGELRFEPTQKRVRALLGDETVVDSRRAVTVWEPKRVVPSYAVPKADITARLVPAHSAGAEGHPVSFRAEGPPVLDPRTGFAVHTCAGEPLSLEVGATVLPDAGFRPSDPELEGFVVFLDEHLDVTLDGERR